MCWAAAASNMIYWWLDQNKEYVERFAYTGPKEYLNALQCEVFEHYKKRFPNKGGHVYEALDWFFTGRPIEEAKPDVEHGSLKPSWAKMRHRPAAIRLFPALDMVPCIIMDLAMVLFLLFRSVGCLCWIGIRIYGICMFCICTFYICTFGDCTLGKFV